jgi:lysophospholipase L1-like esterase
MRRLALLVTLIGSTALVCELALLVSRMASPRVEYLLSAEPGRRSVADSILGHRVSPFLSGHDNRGYRNPVALERAEILAVGDSYTYGWGARPSEAWPQVLGGLTGRSAYNAGVVGYGFCEYEAVVEELLDLRPEVVVIGVFVGNDLADAYRSTYLEERCPHLITSDSTVHAQLQALDGKATIHQRAVELGWEVPEAFSIESFALGGVRQWLSDRSSLYGLAREVRWRLSPSHGHTFEMAAGLPGRLPWGSNSTIRTVFDRPDMFALTVDLDDPRINEGFRIGKTVLESLRDGLGRRGTRLVVLLIPSKVGAYAPLISLQAESLPPALFRFAEMEDAVRKEFSTFLEREGFEFVDATEALQSALEREVPVYPKTDDHHNSAGGYAVIARLVAGFLERE